MNKSAPFHLRWRGRVTGPFALDDVLHQLDQHEIGLFHELGQGSQWTTLGEFLEAEKRSREEADNARQLAKTRQPLPEPQAVASARPAPVTALRPGSGPGQGLTPGNASLPPAAATAGKNLKLFILLGLLFGYTGAHNFYAGYWGTALVQVLLTAGTFLLGFGFIVSWVWALIELLVVHTDAGGRPMR